MNPTDRHRVLVIAEAGVNHNGDPELAAELVSVASRAGADIVKFQTFRAAELASERAAKAQYQRRLTGAAESQRAMLQRLELSDQDHVSLKKQCDDAGIEFLSTPFGVDSLRFLLELGISRIKIASGEITNAPLLLAAARSGLPIVMSTGMATLDEVRQALAFIAYGIARQEGAPTTEEAGEALDSLLGTDLLRKRITLLHCTSEYPAPLEHVNLLAMDTLATEFGLPVGYSDHSEGMTVPTAAAARGATVIEKHFTLDRSLPGPDHAASLEPEELADMIRAIRDVERALGSPDKVPSEEELETRQLVRRSLVAKRPVKTGEPFTEENLTSLRPADGISPMRLGEILGKPATKDYPEGEAIEE